MNFKKFAAIFRNAENIRIEYEIINNHLYLMTPYMACVIANISSLPKALTNIAKPCAEPGETKKRIMGLMENQEFDFAINTQMTFKKPGEYTPCTILQGTDITGKPYPVLVNSEYYSLAPENPESILTSGRTGVVVINGNEDVYLIKPVRCSQQTLVHILGTVQAFCLEITAEESGLPAPYVKFDDVLTVLSNLSAEGPPCGANRDEAWDEAIFRANQAVKNLPMKLFDTKEK